MNLKFNTLIIYVFCIFSFIACNLVSTSWSLSYSESQQTFSPGNLSLLIAYLSGALLTLTASYSSKDIIRFSVVHGAILVLIFWVSLQTMISMPTAQTYVTATIKVWIFSFIWSVCLNSQNHANGLRISFMRTWIFGSITWSIISFFQFLMTLQDTYLFGLAGDANNKHKAEILGIKYTRINVFMEDPNMYAITPLIGSICAILMPINYTLKVFIFLINLTSIFLSGSRSAFMALSIFIFFLILDKYKKINILHKIALSVFAFILVFTTITALTLGRGLNDDSTIERFIIYSLYLKEGFSLENILPKGFGIFESQIYAGLGYFRATHNMFLDFLISYGILGLVIWSSIILISIYYLYRSERRVDHIGIALLFMSLFQPLSTYPIFGIFLGWITRKPFSFPNELRRQNTSKNLVDEKLAIPSTNL